MSRLRRTGVCTVLWFISAHELWPRSIYAVYSTIRNFCRIDLAIFLKHLKRLMIDWPFEVIDWKFWPLISKFRKFRELWYLQYVQIKNFRKIVYYELVFQTVKRMPKTRKSRRILIQWSELFKQKIALLWTMEKLWNIKYLKKRFVVKEDHNWCSIQILFLRKSI